MIHRLHRLVTSSNCHTITETKTDHYCHSNVFHDYLSNYYYAQTHLGVKLNKAFILPFFRVEGNGILSFSIINPLLGLPPFLRTQRLKDQETQRMKKKRPHCIVCRISLVWSPAFRQAQSYLELLVCTLAFSILNRDNTTLIRVST